MKKACLGLLVTHNFLRIFDAHNVHHFFDIADKKQKFSAYLTGMNTKISIWLGNNSFQN